jgi:hypothetical protein
MARPPLSEKSIRTSVLQPESAHARVQELASAKQVSAAWVIRMAVTEFLGEPNAPRLQLLNRSLQRLPK